MAIIQLRDDSTQNLIQALIAKQQLELAREQNAQRKKDFDLRVQEFQFQQAQRQQQLQLQQERVQQVMQAARGGDPVAQQTLQSLGVPAAGAITPQGREHLNQRLQVLGARESPAQPSMIESRQAQIAGAAEMRRIVGSFKPELQGPVQQLLALHSQGMPAAAVNEIAGLVLPPTEAEQLDVEIKRSQLTTARVEAASKVAERGAAQYVTETFFPEIAQAGGRVPNAVVADVLRVVTDKQLDNDPREKIFQLASSLVTRSVVDALGIPRPVYDVDEAIQRANEAVGSIFPDAPNVLSDDQRLEVELLSRWSNAYYSNTLLGRRERLADDALRQDLFDKARSAGITDEALLQRVWQRAKAKSSTIS